MNDDDSSAAEAFQMELEQRQREEEAGLNRCRKLTRELRDETTIFERETEEHHARFVELTRS
jgi:hypothetical protein